MHKLPQVLKELRENRGLTQEALATLLKYKSSVTIVKWENGSRTPDLENLIMLAKFFHVSLDVLVGLED